jgi:plastocyanin
MNHRKWIAVSSAALLLVLTALVTTKKMFATTSPSDSSAVEVKIDNFSFSPETLTVKVGTPVTWTNRDDMAHTVVSEDKSFKSKALDTDEKFSFTPTKAGTYTYYCSIHPRMTGKLIVE